MIETFKQSIAKIRFGLVTYIISMQYISYLFHFVLRDGVAQIFKAPNSNSKVASCILVLCAYLLCLREKHSTLISKP